jgi:hypothetical protein
MSDSTFDRAADLLTSGRLLACRYTPAEAAARARLVYEAVQRDSPRLRIGNFTSIATADLALLFDLYDQHFFGGQVRRLLLAGGAPLVFKLSRRLTRSAGTTTRFHRRHGSGCPPTALRYEIAISTTLLFQSFADVERTVRVSGLVCRDRLEALQRVLEHEILHLLEMLLWGLSSCSGERFKDLAINLFGHTETRHDLITQRERALTQFDVRVGARVTFVFDGVRHTGVVNRITRRATVLVEHPAGAPYRDGRRYQKFYVPLQQLEKAD